MTTTKQSWLKQSLAVLLAVMMVMSMGVANVFAAEPTVYDELNALLDEIDSLDGSQYVKSGYDALLEQTNSVNRPVRPPEGENDQGGMPENVAELFLGMLQQQMSKLVLLDSAWGKLETLLDEIFALNSEDYVASGYDALMEQAKSVNRPIDPEEMPENMATIVMVLHDINQSLYYSDEIVAMKDGRMIAHGLPEEIITKELVKEVYGVDLTIQSVDGKPFVIPV